MDWLDAYLDNLADGRNVVYPPDKNTWTPVKPSKQQQSMIQDAVAFDQQQQMRMIQEAREELERHGASRDAAMGIGADPGSPAVQTTTTPAPAFPTSISIAGDNLYGNTGNPILGVPFASFFDEFDYANAPYNETEMAGIIRSNVPPYTGVPPFILYANFIPNASGGHDYIYMGYLLTDLASYYNGGSIASGRWFIGNGYSFSNDNQGYYTNYGYYTALQSNSTLPSTNIANWTRVPGYADQSGNISNITFNY